MVNAVDHTSALPEENAHLLNSISPVRASNGIGLDYVQGKPSRDFAFSDSTQSEPLEFQEAGTYDDWIEPVSSLPQRGASSRQTFFQRIVQWLQGPQPARPFKIRPILPDIQLRHLVWSQERFPRRSLQVIFYAGACCLWALVFLGILRYTLSYCNINDNYPSRLSCTSRFW